MIMDIFRKLVSKNANNVKDYRKNFGTEKPQIRTYFLSIYVLVFKCVSDRI